MFHSCIWFCGGKNIKKKWNKFFEVMNLHWNMFYFCHLSSSLSMFLSTSSIITPPPPSLHFLSLSLPPLSPGDWVNSSEWQADPAAVDGWADPLRWDQCPGGGGEGGYGEHLPPLTGWPRGPGCWPPSFCPCWLSAWPGRPSPPQRRRRPLWNLKVSSGGSKRDWNEELGRWSRGVKPFVGVVFREQVYLCQDPPPHLKPDLKVLFNVYIFSCPHLTCITFILLINAPHEEH